MTGATHRAWLRWPTRIGPPQDPDPPVERSSAALERILHVRRRALDVLAGVFQARLGLVDLAFSLQIFIAYRRSERFFTHSFEMLKFVGCLVLHAHVGLLSGDSARVRCCVSRRRPIGSS